MPFNQPPSKWRLNPFIFPSDTDFRFLLLIAGVTAASLFAFNSLQVDIFSAQWHQVTRECLTASMEAFPRDVMAQFQYEKECREPFEKLQATWILGGLCLLIIVAIMVYWLLPHWRIWRNQLVPFTAEDDPRIAACLADLCREAALPSAPIFLQNSINPSRGGLAFGRLGRYFVVLNGGLITGFNTDLSQFRAVIRHELAHIKNSDIDKTYFSVAIAFAFTTVALIPLAFSLIDDVFSGELRLGLGLAWRAFALAGLVYLMLSAVLRTREVYADVRASVWDGPTGALRRILDTSSQSKSKRWPEFLSFHPRSLTERDRGSYQAF